MKVTIIGCGILFAGVLFSINLASQCIGDSIMKYVNNDPAIQKEIRQIFDIKKRHSIIVNADTSFVYPRGSYISFKDSLIYYGYSQKIVDSLWKASSKFTDTLGQHVPFCGGSYILNDANYNPRREYLVLLLGPYHDSLIAGELIYCTGDYYNPGTLQRTERIHFMFLMNKASEIKQVMRKPGKVYIEQPVYR